MTDADLTLPGIFSEGRPSDANKVLLYLPDGRTLSYGDVFAGAARIASVFAAAGVERGDRVALLVEKSPAALLVYLACATSGMVLLPMNPGYTDDEVAYILGDADPALVVCDPARAGATGDRRVLLVDREGRGSLTDAAATAAPTPVGPTPEPGDLAAILYTSGTTGKPKGAMLTQDNLASNGAALQAAWGFSESDVLVHALPIFHTHGLFVATNTVLSSGASMRFLPRFDPDAVLSAFAGATVFMGVPTYYTRLLADPRLGEAACSGLRLFVSGSAPLLASTHEEFRRRTGQVILERYGMTELSMITSNPLVGERRPGTVGFPLPRVEVRLAEVEDGIGEIEVRGPNVFPGYWGRPALGPEEMSGDGFFRTGDLGSIDEDGYLSIVGRSKDLVISGGLNVYPVEVEAVLDALAGVLESAVIGLPDADLGEAVVAVLVPEEGAVLAEEEIRAAARARLAGFKVPKRVHVLDALPRNAMGKVEKAALRRRFGS